MKEIDKKNQVLNDAQRRMIVDNMTFAENVAKQYARLGMSRGVSFDELRAEAYYGLCEAALRFDERQDADFKTFAYSWCRKFVLGALRCTAGNECVEVESVGDVVADDEDRQTDHEGMTELMLGLLTAQERKVVCLIYGYRCEMMDWRQTAKALHLTTTRVHKIYERAMVKMEKGLDQNYYRMYARE